MNGRWMVRGLVTLMLTSALVAAIASGCGGDEGADSEDPERNVAAASLPYNEACCADAECSDGKCADFNNKGKRCTKTCTADTDCAGLGEGRCGGQGVCSVPD
jgi:hypothetical protein